MQPTPRTDARPEAMADVPGACEIPLTRAVVHYRDRHEIQTDGGRIQDIGLGLVLDGNYASSAHVVDLGCGEIKELDLSSGLVILDWAYEPTLHHVRELTKREAGTSSTDARAELERYCFDLAIRVLKRVGYGHLTRPVVLRIGFRDICRDLDLHAGTAVRIQMGNAGVLRAHLDYDGAALAVRTALTRPSSVVESVLAGAFPDQDVRRVLPSGPAASMGYQVRFGLPLTLGEAREMLLQIRRGLGHMLARFESDRQRSVDRLLETFGARDSLARLQMSEHAERTVPVPSPEREGSWRVH